MNPWTCPQKRYQSSNIYRQFTSSARLSYGPKRGFFGSFMESHWMEPPTHPMKSTVSSLANVAHRASPGSFNYLISTAGFPFSS